MHPTDLSGPLAVVTGASSGIGPELALQRRTRVANTMRRTKACGMARSTR
ncbi:hypothetical protein [Variovorax sp. PBL-E5]|nr:hypothetical protein [Variovorax sp. PBL-E5]VTU22403.1 hypothetical protein E5CHR_01383 [Variovorax sp. PBL-E5]